MTAVSPTYEISIPIEGSREQALALAQAIEWWLHSDPDPDRPLQEIGVGAIAVRPLEPVAEGRGAGLRQLLGRRSPVLAHGNAA